MSNNCSTLMCIVHMVAVFHHYYFTSQHLHICILWLFCSMSSIGVTMIIFKVLWVGSQQLSRPDIFMPYIYALLMMTTGIYIQIFQQKYQPKFQQYIICSDRIYTSGCCQLVYVILCCQLLEDGYKDIFSHMPKSSR